MKVMENATALSRPATTMGIMIMGSGNTE